MLLNYNYPPAQGWFDEGLAEYFSSIRVDNKQVELGGDPELLRLTDRMLGNQRIRIPQVSHRTARRPGLATAARPLLHEARHLGQQRGTHHTLYYAESWIVMHYLLHEKKLPETGAYFDLVLNQHFRWKKPFRKPMA